MRDLPVHRGYPVPWFVAVVEGVPDFRIADGRKIAEAIRQSLCWICGKRISKGDRFGFVVGPMCAVNRISSEPPQHVECARFSAMACPFLTRPHAKRREAGRPDGHVEPGGTMIHRNPGVSLVWVTRSFRVVPTETGPVFGMGRSVRLEAYREGRTATPAEIRESVDAGLPLLKATVDQEGYGAREMFRRQVAEAERLLGIAP
jgi:hypothetical protein